MCVDLLGLNCNDYGFLLYFIFGICKIQVNLFILIIKFVLVLVMMYNKKKLWYYFNFVVL